ncbi:MAG: hypothetical protein JSS60_00975 [Verrucomicrobia bacterium]|nr:hypothetical protein [Verrucomicrobiota bacterium]
MTNKIDNIFTTPKHLTLSPQQTPITTQSIPCPPSFSTSSLSRLNAKAAEGGFCDWVKELIQKICRFFGLASEPETSIARASRLLEEKISLGKGVIDSHMQKDFIVNANTPNKAIIITIKYNGECKVDYGKAQNVKNDIEVAKAMVRELLSRHPSAVSTKLEISTMLITKRSNNDFDIHHVDDSVNFANGVHQGGSRSNEGCGLIQLGRILLSAIPEHQNQRAIASFIRDQL